MSHLSPRNGNGSALHSSRSRPCRTCTVPGSTDYESFFSFAIGRDPAERRGPALRAPHRYVPARCPRWERKPECRGSGVRDDGRLGDTTAWRVKPTSMSKLVVIGRGLARLRSASPRLRTPCQTLPRAGQAAQKAYVRRPAISGRLPLSGVPGGGPPRPADCVLRPVPGEAMARCQGTQDPDLRATLEAIGQLVQVSLRRLT